MTTADIVDRLKTMTNEERLEIIEVAKGLLRERALASQPSSAKSPYAILEMSGSASFEPLPPGGIDEEIYGPME